MKRDAIADSLRADLAAGNRSDPKYFVRLVDSILDAARDTDATDVHLQPEEAAVRVSLRIDGELHDVAVVAREDGPNVVVRLKVLAGLLTYQLDVPQEGRIPAGNGRPEIRVSVFPTVFGERTALRVFAKPNRLLQLADLGFAPTMVDAIRRVVNRTSGLFAVVGPAGSGKTTTLYACIREILARSKRNVVTVEDPVESIVAGAAQSAIRPAAGFDFSTALRSIMRQDPDVIVVGEVRDAATAHAAFQASLTGHLVLTTFHAGTTTAALRRFIDMGVEPHVVQSGILAILAQRILRSRDDDSDCGGKGGFPIGEMLLAETPGLMEAVGNRASAGTLRSLAVASGMVPIGLTAQQALQEGKVSHEEIARVFGPNPADA